LCGLSNEVANTVQKGAAISVDYRKRALVEV
jgi:hypothetical protein